MPRNAAPAVGLLLLLCLSACGGGGADPTSPGQLPPPAALSITTDTLPGGSTSSPYPDTQLTAANAQGAVTWQATSGALPVGLTFSGSGLLEGQPTQLGTFTFEIEASDGVASDSRAYSIVVAEFSFTVTSGLVGSDAWAGAAVTLETVGASGNVVFDFEANNSGGSYTASNGAAGTATYVPGSTTDVVDRLRATNQATGESAVLSLGVAANPAPNMVAHFGTTDVWYIDTNVKRGTHQHRTDFLQACADVRLLPQGTGSQVATNLESLVEVTMRLQVLKELSLIYLRNADGSQGTGTRISFPFTRPDPNTYSAPNPGSLNGGSSTRFSIIEFADLQSTNSGVLGRAFFNQGNTAHENNSGAEASDANRLGTFTNAIRESFLGWQFNEFVGTATVSNVDIPVLEDILYGRASSGSRHDQLLKLVQWFARALAIVTAHEVGHSLGFDHTNNATTLMASSIGFSDSALSTSNAISFIQSEVDTMNGVGGAAGTLAGPGRASGLNSRNAAAQPEGPAVAISVGAQLPR